MMPSSSTMSPTVMAASSHSVTVLVDKATSDLLLGPDWTLNISICDFVNTNHWQTKDVIKAVKRRLQHKNPKVQFLALTLLETMMKNCGDYVHSQVLEREILQEMVKIVKKKTDMQVRDKALILIDSWQEALAGRYPQYYSAYAELRGYGIEFPPRSPDAAPIFTPPVTHPPPMLALPQPMYGMPGSPTVRFNEVMSPKTATLSASDAAHIQSVIELLSEMLKAVNPNDQRAVGDEVIVDLVAECSSHQKRLMDVINSTSDEELLGKALDLNDKLQTLLAKHNAIATGSPLPPEIPECLPAPNTSLAIPSVTSSGLEEEDEDDDEFAQLARRNLKLKSADAEAAQSSSHQFPSQQFENLPNPTVTSQSSDALALALPDPPAPIKTSVKDEDMINFLSLTLASNPSPPRSPLTPPVEAQHDTSPVVTPAISELPYIEAGEQYTNQGGYATYNSYNPPPWAQARPDYPQPPWATAPVDPISNPFMSTTALSRPPSTVATDTPAQPFRANLRPAGPTSAPRPSYVSSNTFFADLIERNSDGSLKKSSIAASTSTPGAADNGKK